MYYHMLALLFRGDTFLQAEFKGFLLDWKKWVARTGPLPPWISRLAGKRNLRSFSPVALSLALSLLNLPMESILIKEDLMDEIPEQVKCIIEPYRATNYTPLLQRLFSKSYIFHYRNSFGLGKLRAALSLFISSGFPAYKGKIPINWTSSAGGRPQWIRFATDPYSASSRNFISKT